MKLMLAISILAACLNQSHGTGTNAVGSLTDEQTSDSSARRKLHHTCSARKDVRIYKFWINGDCDAGAHGEHKFRLNGNRYYPRNDDDCDAAGGEITGGGEYCSWREGQAHELRNAGWWRIYDDHRSITVGTEELDDGFWNENDSTTASLSRDQWYIDTCDIYEIQFSANFKEETLRSVCWSAEAKIAAERGGASAEVSGRYESCSTWTEPAQSFVWFMDVRPAWGGVRSSAVAPRGEPLEVTSSNSNTTEGGAENTTASSLRGNVTDPTSSNEHSGGTGDDINNTMTGSNDSSGAYLCFSPRIPGVIFAIMAITGLFMGL